MFVKLNQVIFESFGGGNDRIGVCFALGDFGLAILHDLHCPVDLQTLLREIDLRLPHIGSLPIQCAALSFEFVRRLLDPSPLLLSPSRRGNVFANFRTW